MRLTGGVQRHSVRLGVSTSNPTVRSTSIVSRKRKLADRPHGENQTDDQHASTRRVCVPQSGVRDNADLSTADTPRCGDSNRGTVRARGLAAGALLLVHGLGAIYHGA